MDSQRCTSDVPRATRIADLIGVPFLTGGRDWRVGLDCYGLTLRFCNDLLGFAIPDVWETVEANYKDGGDCRHGMPAGWGAEIDEHVTPRPGDLWFLANPSTPTIARHLVVVFGQHKALETSQLLRRSRLSYQRTLRPFVIERWRPSTSSQSTAL